MRIRLHHLSVPAVAAAAALAIAGCGGGSSSGTADAAAPSSGGAYGGSAQAQAPAKTTGAAAVNTAKGPLGTFLTDAQGRTLYLWKADTGSQSTCEGACAHAWPPLTTKGAPKASGGADAASLGTTKRSDGTVQLTYANHPLYLFAGDQAAGETEGQGSDGFGALWYVVGPDGSAITKP